MTTYKNDRLLRALKRQSVDTTPVWILRQAGRYLPEYRACRKKAGNFSTLYKIPALACEVTLQPLARYTLDAAIIFSDILVVPEALGLTLTFAEGKGPQFANPIQDPKDIIHLPLLDPHHLQYVYDAIQLVKQELNHTVPLIGFCGSPWTLAAYMIQGCSVKNFPRLKALRNEEPALLHMLLKKLAQSVNIHLNAQINAGAEIIMLFDTWDTLLESTTDYATFSLPYIKQALEIQTHTHQIPTILFAPGGNRWLEQVVSSGCDAISLDSTLSLNTARQRVGQKVALQGNLNPALLMDPTKIRHAVADILASFGHGPGHIFNLSHGVPPSVPPENIEILVNAVHELSPAYHQNH